MLSLPGNLIDRRNLSRNGKRKFRRTSRETFRRLVQEPARMGCGFLYEPENYVAGIKTPHLVKGDYNGFDQIAKDLITKRLFDQRKQAEVALNPAQQALLRRHEELQRQELEEEEEEEEIRLLQQQLDEEEQGLSLIHISEPTRPY